MAAHPLNLDDLGGQMYNLSMSEKARPLLEAVKKFIATEVDPMSEQFHKLGEGREDRWSYAPGQLEMLQPAKATAFCIVRPFTKL